jgi:large subunit ribosomal protein L29
MKAAKWRDLSDDEVQQRVRELGEEIFNLRFQLSMGVAKNPARLGQARKDLARAKTILWERRGPVPKREAAPVRREAAPVRREAAPVKKEG